MRLSFALVRVAVVGQGLIGRQRAEAVQTIEHAILAATIDPVAPQAETLAPGIPHAASLSDVDPTSYDAAVVSVPHDVAPNLAAHVLTAGKPVLMEKPLGVSAAEAVMLEDLAAAVRLPSFVGFNYRYLPAIQALLKDVESGRFGRLRSVDMLIGHGGHPGSAESWKLDPRRAGGGVLLDPGVHLLDLLLQIVPDAACTGVEGTTGFWGTGVEEDVVATFRAGATLASIRASHVRWINTFRVEVFGDDGYAIAEGRGGNYGPMAYRTGERWAWARDKTKSQRDSEKIDDYGSRDRSLRDELAAVIRSWQLGTATPSGGIHPATMAEARAVTELCVLLYDRMT